MPRKTAFFASGRNASGHFPLVSHAATHAHMHMHTNVTLDDCKHCFSSNSN